MPFPNLFRKRSPDGAITEVEGIWLELIFYYSFIDPEGMKGGVGLVGWPIATKPQKGEAKSLE